MEHTAGAQMAVTSPGNKYLPWDRPHMGSLWLVKVSLLRLWNKSRGVSHTEITLVALCMKGRSPSDVYSD